MPKSKRDRQVTLSKTKKKGREHKEIIVNTIRQAAEDYSSAYVFSFENMRNHKFKEFREQLKSNSRTQDACFSCGLTTDKRGDLLGFDDPTIVGMQLDYKPIW